ncbi:MAG: transcriptional regulator [Leifsonia sp.]|nr:transcriptional regulator [Leifsonia sp.]|tara:strand:- start:3495 stop:3977 length:483 start_codon:yes stop_codon:yes gene_type:complete
MPDLDPAGLDLPTIAALAAEAANAHLLDQLHAAGFTGVRAAHGYLLQALVDERPSVGELAARLGVTQQAISKTVTELESLGIAHREADAHDSRVRRVALTARGEDLLETSRRIRSDLDARVAAELGDLAAAKRALAALLEAAGGVEAVRQRRVRPVDGEL